MFNIVVFHLPQAHTCSRVVFSIGQPLRVAYRLKSIIPGVCNLKVAPMKKKVIGLAKWGPLGKISGNKGFFIGATLRLQKPRSIDLSLSVTCQGRLLLKAYSAACMSLW